MAPTFTENAPKTVLRPFELDLARRAAEIQGEGMGSLRAAAEELGVNYFTLSTSTVRARRLLGREVNPEITRAQMAERMGCSQRRLERIRRRVRHIEGVFLNW